MYGTGFGPTNPPIPPGTAAFAPAVTTYPVLLETDSFMVTPSWAGLIGPGLYQLNVVVPDVPDGDYRFNPRAAASDGADAWITIRR